MGQYTYLKANTHLKKEKLEELSYLISGMTGSLVQPVKYESGKTGNFVCFPAYSISYEINEQDEIILKSSAKWTSYQKAKEFRFGTFNTIERIASYLGGVEVEVISEEGISPHPNAKDGVYKYKTPVKDIHVNLDKNELKKQVSEYLPVRINAELFQNERDERFRGIHANEAVSIIERNFSEHIKKAVQFANVTAFLSYRGKTDTDFTKEELKSYLSRNKQYFVAIPRITGIGNSVLVNTSMRCKGMEEFFQSIGREDLANVVKEAEEIIKRKERITKKKNDFLEMFPKNMATNCQWWETNDKSNSWLHGNEAVTVSLYDDSDFYHLPKEQESKLFPFGEESVSVTVMPSESVSFSYKNKSPEGETLENIKSKSFYQMLDNIKDPAFLKSILKGMNDAQNVNVSEYISEREMELLREKLPAMEERKQRQMQEISEGYIYIKVPFKEKDEAKALGAFWDSEKKSWFVSKDSDLSKYEKWLPEEQKEEEKEKELE